MQQLFAAAVSDGQLQPCQDRTCLCQVAPFKWNTWQSRDLKQQTEELSIYQYVPVGVQEEERPLAALFSVNVVLASLSLMAGELHPTRYTEGYIMGNTLQSHLNVNLLPFYHVNTNDTKAYFAYIPCTSRHGGKIDLCVHDISFLIGHKSPFFQRKAELECFQGSWDRVVSCQPVDCGLPDQSHVYHAIFSCSWGTTFGKQCSFTCGSPAILQGKEGLSVFCCILLYILSPTDHANKYLLLGNENLEC